MSVSEALVRLLPRVVPWVHPEISLRLGHLLFSLPLSPCRELRGEVRVGSARFLGPLGVAAGLDKQGRYTRFLSHFCPGFIVVGSTTLRPRRGNRPPRAARYRPMSMVNAMGLNSEGVEAVIARLWRVDYPLAVSVAGFSYDEIVRQVEYVDRAAPPWVQAIEVNLSSPTYKGMWRDLAAPLASARRQVLVKVGPGFDVRQYARLALREGLGLVVTNTLPIEDRRLSTGYGGLSGPLIYPLTIAMLRAAREAAGPELPLVGVGGIATCSQLREVLAYANAAEMLTGILYMGPGVLRSLNLNCVRALSG